ncbi:metal ABC transporter solute-binding protein, Zn/Mn family [Aerococcus kribbianus]|uniref:Zinc ABC transporter substrate-binding protein n=1 Tax=Aerococcus kribbianus TaxID=2999064 RepID=A0A9X3FP78_9LACT|nr:MULTISPECIES: zinc ABC transporter substrate-binding protein [unclassified Aerococcus]MCZ0718098.1 zinc ABC transporter substrate-binding protein [Aerococcus sp. YH-aer221]MCZ0726333.1 zinc ABC transporter substrate-binding protein [Aerococcus sp. YH-aer222]
MKIRQYLLALVSLFFLAACGQASQEKDENQGLTIVTSFYPIYAITQEVAGDENTVQMIQSGQGIHGFEPSANDMRAINDADVFVYHSKHLESWAGNMGKNLADSQVKVIEGSKDLDLKRTQGLEDVETSEGIDEAQLADVHTWTDPIVAGQEAMTIAEQLAEIDPENADLYRENAKQFQVEAQSLVDKYKDDFDQLDQKNFVTQHTAFAYLADRFGLQQIGIAGADNTSEPSAQTLSEIEDFVSDYNVQTIYTEENVSPKYAQVVSDATGAEMDTLSPLEADPENDKTYLENLEANIKVLYDNMAKENQN